MRRLHQLMMGILLLVSTGLFAQKKQLTGKVLDASGAPIPAATIKIKGTKTGTSANFEGEFSLPVDNGTTLIISGIGYESKEVKVGSLTTLSVNLNTDSKSLSEVVVTGTGTATSKKKLGISVESVGADKLPPAPTASIDQALVGKIPGAQISSVDGTPGAGVNILLRGINTLQGSTMPMILLDGVEVRATSLQSLDLTNIANVEVVQGAASAALYGAQGANGVIQLFSKKGKNGTMNIDISSNVSRSEYLNIGHLRKAPLHSFVTDASNNIIGSSGNPIVMDSSTGTFSANTQWLSTDPTTVNNKPYDHNLQYHDHFKEFFIPANTYNNSVTISGAKDKMDFLFSLSNNHQESNFKNNGYNDRSNLTANIGAEILKGLRLRSVTQVVYTRNTVLSDQGFLYALNNTQPFADYSWKFADGTPSMYYGSAAGVNGYNPNYGIYYTDWKDNKVDVIQSLNLNYKLGHILELDGKAGLNYQNDYNQTVYPNQAKNLNTIATGDYFGAAEDGSVYDGYYNHLFQNYVAQAIVHLDFANDFKLKIPLVSTTIGGFDFRKDKETYNNFYGVGLPEATPYTAGAANSYYSNGAAITPFVTYGYLVAEKLDFADFAGIGGGFRTDYSSAFGAGHSPFTFPNANAYFRISGLDFWKNSKISDVITELKFRGAYGEAGIQPKPFDRYITLSQHTLGGSTGYYFPSSSSNPNLQVETSVEKEVGADLSLNVLKGSWLKNITLQGTYWSRKSDRTIWAVDAAPSTGVGTIKTNAFSMGSDGIQFGLNISVLGNKDFMWNFTTNFGHAVSKILSTAGAPVVLTSAAGSTGYVLTPGEKVGQLYGYLTLHSVDAADPATGESYIAKADQGSYTVASNGIVVNKATKQPYVTPSTHSFGDPNPKFNASFINEFSYKGWLTVNVQLDWIHGSHIYNQTKEWMYRDGIHSDYSRPITIDGQTAAWTAFYRGMYAQVSRNGTKSYFYEDASFLRLRNVAVAVDLAKALKINHMKKLQLVLSGRNIWTHTKYTGFDPEISSGNTNSPWDRGTDHNTMPNFKSYQAGVNIGL